jgi:formylglycine-generating enzyme required for sulfatase activity
MASERVERLSYLDFELEIGLGSGGDYPVAVVRSPAGEARETMHLLFGEQALRECLTVLQDRFSARDFGQKLFEALFSGEVRSRYDVSLDRAEQQVKGLRLKLRIQAPELAALPWELLYDPSRDEYVCLSRDTPLVRYLELSQPIWPLVVSPPLHILGVVSSPCDLVPLDIAQEKQRVEEGLSDLQAQGLVTLTWLAGQTWRDLLQETRGGPWHVLHFIGHGGFDQKAGEGFIVLADEKGKARRLSADELGLLLADHHSLRLVLLNSCAGARGGERDVFSSAAATLVRRGIPVVVAMQDEISDGAAIEFSRTFYEALADGLPVDAAVAEVRKAISLAVPDAVEWAAPALFMRAPDGVILAVQEVIRESKVGVAAASVGVKPEASADVDKVVVSHQKQVSELEGKVTATTVTWLHLSDLHHRQPDSPGNRTHLRHAKIVLGKLLEDIQKLIRDEGLQLDFIVFTGDVAYSGHLDEYMGVGDGGNFDRAADFFDRLLDVTNLPKDRLFVVPGNHDVDWTKIDVKTASDCHAKLTNRDAVMDFLAPENAERRVAALRKFENYAEFVQKYFGGALSFSAKEFFFVKHLPLCRPVAILGLNSACMSGFVVEDGKPQDRGHLLVGELQVRDALDRARGAEVKIALLHHPFDWLQDFDRQQVEPLLFQNCHFILRGHQHRSDFTLLQSPDARTIVIPAGACYHRREYRGDGEYNGYNFVRLDFSTGKGVIFWRQYDDRRGGRWAADTGLFDKAPQGKYEFGLPVSPPLEPGPPVELQIKSIPETIFIPAGEFWMGSDPYDREAHDNEKPRHGVDLRSYEIGKYPVTNAQYRAFVRETGHRAPEHWKEGQVPPGKENHPVVNVSWDDARAFCRWLTRTTDRLHRLPTEAEWEKAAGWDTRTRSRRRYPWGDEWQEGAANTSEAGFNDTTSVTAFEGKNVGPFGVVDMAGNVMEWTESPYEPYPGSTYQSETIGGTRYVVRGGCFTLPRSNTRVSWRGRYTPGTVRPFLGFRVVTEVK